MATLAQDDIVRRRFEVRGIVQGVGFRPFVHRLARKLSLAGWVRNDAAGVTIEVEGDAAGVERLARSLRDEAPPLARVDAIARIDCAPERSGAGFAILDSGGGRAATAIGPDTAICGDCLSEMLDPRDRRYRYAFINCTNCGPRYTITRRLPYDRAFTSMSAFAQCGTCFGEYHALRDRRFHAEPNACPACGPKLAFLDGRGEPVAGRRRRRRSDRPPPARRHPRHQGSRRIPSRLRCAQRRERRAPARKEGARGKAVRRDGGERRVGADVDGGRHRRADAARSARARHRPAEEAPRDRRSAGRRRPGARVARRDAALRAAPLPAVSRGGGPTGRHRMAGSRTGARAGDDERQSGRRTAGDRQRRGRRAPRRHRRRVRRARPRHRRRLRRQRAARPSGKGAGAVPVRPPRARLHAARDQARDGGAAGASRWAATSRTRSA